MPLDPGNRACLSVVEAYLLQRRSQTVEGPGVRMVEPYAAECYWSLIKLIRCARGYEAGHGLVGDRDRVVQCGRCKIHFQIIRGVIPRTEIGGESGAVRVTMDGCLLLGGLGGCQSDLLTS